MFLQICISGNLGEPSLIVRPIFFAMNDHPATWVEFAFIASGVAVFLALLLLPMIVCWRRVARLYRDGPFTAGRVFYSVSVNFGRRVGRGYSHHLAVGKQGLRLFAILPLRRLCPAILIPWEEIHSLRGKPSSLGCDSLFIEIHGVPTILSFEFLWRHGKALSLVQQYWEGTDPAAAPESAPSRVNPAPPS